jgi:hypothetical protein
VSAKIEHVDAQGFLELLQWSNMTAVAVLEEMQCKIAKAFCIPSYLLREPRPPSECIYDRG